MANNTHIPTSRNPFIWNYTIVVPDQTGLDFFTFVYFTNKYGEFRYPNVEDLKFLERVLQICPNILECGTPPCVKYSHAFRKAVTQTCVMISPS